MLLKVYLDDFLPADFYFEILAKATIPEWLSPSAYIEGSCSSALISA